MGRDMDCGVDRLDRNATTSRRDKFFTRLFSQAIELSESPSSTSSGWMFWSYAGLGKPENIGEWIGDPPHEPRGWYSIYTTDSIWPIVKDLGEKYRLLSKVQQAGASAQ